MKFWNQPFKKAPLGAKFSDIKTTFCSGSNNDTEEDTLMNGLLLNHSLKERRYLLEKKDNVISNIHGHQRLRWQKERPHFFCQTENSETLRRYWYKRKISDNHIKSLLLDQMLKLTSILGKQNLARFSRFFTTLFTSIVAICRKTVDARHKVIDNVWVNSENFDAIKSLKPLAKRVKIWALNISGHLSWFWQNHDVGTVLLYVRMCDSLSETSLSLLSTVPTSQKEKYYAFFHRRWVSRLAILMQSFHWIRNTWYCKETNLSKREKIYFQKKF